MIAWNASWNELRRSSAAGPDALHSVTRAVARSVSVVVRAVHASAVRPSGAGSAATARERSSSCAAFVHASAARVAPGSECHVGASTSWSDVTAGDIAP